MSEQETLRVWDPFVRISHWSMVLGVVAAFLTAERWPEIHETIGYAIGILVILRIVWGFIGPRHARFSDFVRGPTAVRSYMLSLLALRGRRYVGHSPAGGAMVVLLLILVSVVVSTGMISEQQREAASVQATATIHQGSAVPVAKPGDEGENESLVGEVHEAAANLLLVFVPLHILGVLLASFVHRENLVEAMITGRKRPKSKPQGPSAGTL